MRYEVNTSVLRLNLGRYSIHLIMLAMIVTLLLPSINKRKQEHDLNALQEQIAAELAAEIKTSGRGTGNIYGLNEQDRQQLNLGANPERRILQDLALHPELYPNFAPHTVSQFLLHDSVVLNRFWVLANFQVNQYKGQALYAYSLNNEQKFSWQLLSHQLELPAN